MMQREIDWDPAGWLYAVVALVSLLVAGAVLIGRFDMVVFLSPMIGALGGAWWSAHSNPPMSIDAQISAERVFEDETVTFDVQISTPDGVELVDVELDAGIGLSATLLSFEHLKPGSVSGQWELHARRWGHNDLQIRLLLHGAGGLLVGDEVFDLSQVAVFPQADRISAVPRPVDLPDMLGMHLGRLKGEGTEFAGIREYLPGDSLRSVNWPLTARRGKLHVTERLTEQSAKVVCLIDASGEIAQSGGSSLELSVHGALAVTQAALRRGDRAGVVVVGGVVRWLPPDLGRRHFYRIIETLLDVRRGQGAPPSTASAFPSTMVPYGAAVVVFSPLLDERLVQALVELRQRGFAMVVVDVLRSEPQPRGEKDYDDIAVRLWKMTRRGVRYRLRELGVPVGHWAEDIELDEVLRPMSLRPLVGIRR